MPKVSIIIPVYNAEKVLCHTVDSILSQYYQDFELILVDDGSTDDSGTICDEYSLRGSRVRVIHQANAGVSAARNAGLKAAQGDWVTFVDSDDRVLDCFLEALVEAASRSEQIDLAYCGYAIIEGHSSIKTYASKTYLGKESIHEALSKTYLLYRCSPWAKLFRRSIIVDHGVQFDTNLTISEDRLFLYNYLTHVRGIATTSTIGYLYGSFSPTSLKHRPVPSEMLAYRQQAITQAAHDVINQFDLGKNESFLISRHLMLILFELIRGVYQESGLSRETAKQQRALYEKLFDEQLYMDNLKKDERWYGYLSQNKLMGYMINRQFEKLNWKFWCNDLDLSLRRFAYNALKKRWVTESTDIFDKVVTRLNN